MTNNALNKMARTSEIIKQTDTTPSMDKFILKYCLLLNATMNQK